MPTFISGLDLGQTTDASALAVLEKDDATPAVYTIRQLQRFPVGTSYPAVCAEVVKRWAKPPLLGTSLAVDQTGVGRAICDIMREVPDPGFVLYPITITGGHQVTETPDGYHVPKKDIVGALMRLFQERRLKIPTRHKEAETLLKELRTFQTKITAAANEVYGVWREGLHDDLVLAAAMGAWLDINCFTGTWTVTPQRDIIEAAPPGIYPDAMDAGPTNNYWADRDRLERD